MRPPLTGTRGPAGYQPVAAVARGLLEIRWNRFVGATMPASQLSSSTWTANHAVTDSPIDFDQLERPRLADDRLLWQQRVDEVINDLSDEDEDLFFTGEDLLDTAIDELLGDYSRTK